MAFGTVRTTDVSFVCLLDAFDQNRLVYPDLSWSGSFLTLTAGVMVSDLAFFLPSDEIALPAPFNAPISWWHLWRNVIHGKDEVLRIKTIYMERAPLVSSVLTESTRRNVTTLSFHLEQITCCEYCDP